MLIEPGADVVCTLPYAERAPATIFIDVIVDGQHTSSGSGPLLVIDGVEYNGFTRIETLTGQHSIDPVGGPGFVLDNQLCDLESIDGGTLYDVTEPGGGIYCRFDFSST